MSVYLEKKTLCTLNTYYNNVIKMFYCFTTLAIIGDLTNL